MTNKNFLQGLPLWQRLCATLILGMIASGAALPAYANLFGGEEPLAPEIAFAAELVNVSEETIDIEFTIEEGYYLYRDKLYFSVDDDEAPPPGEGSLNALIGIGESSIASVGEPVFAEARVVVDDYFGKQAIFRDSTVIVLPYTAPASAQNLSLSIKFQGCADIGLCYPPTTTTLDVDLPKQPVASIKKGTFSEQLSSPLRSEIAQSTAKTSNKLLQLQGSADELLPPELAYLPQVISADTTAIDVSWFIEEGYYLYRDKLAFELKSDSGVEIAGSSVSEGVEQFDEFFGNVFVLRNSADAIISLNTDSALANSLAGSNGQLTISYQGCADIGVCFPPSKTTLPVSFKADEGNDEGQAARNSALIPLAASADANYDDSDNDGDGGQALTATAPAQSEQDRLSSLLASSSLWLTVATFFGLGLLLAFTPCVLPMIPILSSLIVGQGQSLTTGRAFQLSLIYVLVMASTYAIVGVVVGLSGYNVQAFLQNPVVLSGIAILFVLLSLSMFGFYELQVPTGIQDKLTNWSNKQGGGQVGGVAAMGFISTLIVGPCVTAPLAGALIYIAKTGDAVVGGAALFALGLGMGAPLLLIGTSAGRLVPKAGAWMNTTKHIFGILMLCMAVYMISRFISTTITMGLYGIIAVMSGVYLGATDSMSRQSGGWQRFGKGAGLVVAIYGVALLIGALAGGKSYTTPLGALAGGGSGTGAMQSDHALPFQTVKSVENLESVIAQASAQGRPVMLDFYADWCISCKEMESFTFSDDRVQELLSTAIVIQADVTANDAEDQAMLKQFDLFGPPGIIFYDALGTELPAARVVGFMNADDFTEHINRFIGNT